MRFSWAFYHFRSALEIMPQSFAPREVTQQALTPRSHSITPLDIHKLRSFFLKQVQGKWMLQPLDPIHLAIHFPIFFRNMLEVAPQSLTPRTGKSTLSKRFKKYGFTGLPLILLWQASIIPFSTQAWAEAFKLYRPPATARVEWGFFTCFSLCFLAAKKPVKAASWSRKHFAKAPVKMCEKKRAELRFQLFSPTVVESSSRQSKIIQTNCQKDSDSFAASEVGRAAAYARMKFYHVAALCFINLIWWYLDVSRSCFLSVAGQKHASALIDVRLEPAGNARTEGYGRVVHVYMVVIKS